MPTTKPPAGHSPFASDQNPFSESLNPYAAPQVTGYAPMQPVWDTPFAGLWAQGDVLVMHKLAPLPDVCLKSNLPSTRRLKRSMSWHHPAFYFLVLLHILVYIIVALIVRKSATIQIPLTDEWYFRRRRRMLIAWCIILLCVTLFFVSLSVADQQAWAPFVMIGSIPMALIAAICGLLSCRMVWPSRMTDQYIWLKGVHPDYLRRLEPWRWNII